MIPVLLAAPSFVPGPLPVHRGSAAISAPALLGATAWFAASAARADEAQEELAQAAATISPDAEDYVPLYAPKLDEANPIRLSDFVSEGSEGLAQGKVEYGVSAFGDVFAELFDRATKSLEEGEIPWDAIGAVFLGTALVANSITFLWPILEDGLAELTGSKEKEKEERLARQRAAAAAEMRRKAARDVDLTLPPREDAAGGSAGGAPGSVA